MVGAAYLWVFIYSLVINSGGDQAYYEAYAQRASPVVAVITAFPVFFLMGKYMRRFEAGAFVAVAGVVILHILMEAIVLSTLNDTFAYVLGFSVAAMCLKIAGGYFGMRREAA